MLEAFKHNFAEIFEGNCFSLAQLGDHIRNKNLIRFGVSTETGSELHCYAKQIVVTFNWFTGGNANTDADRLIGIGLEMFDQFVLNAGRAFHRRGGGNERGHDSIAEMFHFAPAQIF